MASFDTLQKLNEHPEWLAPRSDVRVFLGEPGAPEAVKTTVEPGNVFSPGMQTFGITWWLRMPDSGAFFATETADLDDLRWSYEGGHLPILHCNVLWQDLMVRHTLFQDGTNKQRTEAVMGRLHLTNSGPQPITLQAFIGLRSLGPAGGPVRDVCVGTDGHSFWLQQRDLPLIVFDRPVDQIGCGVGDPSPLAQQGSVPEAQAAIDKAGWGFGLARWDIVLAPHETWGVTFDCPLQTYGNLQREIPSLAQPRPGAFEARLQAHATEWEARLHTFDLDVPDAAFRDAFFAGLQHMLTASVGDQARIAPLSYPLAWLRDSIYIIRCFDLAGWHDRARAATEYCVRNDFFGGFGAEGDAPGQGIWALTEHYRLTQDRDWLARVYPAIQRKCDWLFAMRRASEPIQVFSDTPVLAFTHAERASGVICDAARDGIIMGAMDHGISYSLGWVNHWALTGLRKAAYAAQQLGHTDDTERYQTEADELFNAYTVYCEKHPDIFEQERTVNSLLWPSQVWRPEAVQGHFMRWWGTNRLADGQFQPEAYWLYFEMAQAHNALLMGELDTVWQVLDYRLTHQDLPGLYGWREGGEGVGTENAVHGVTLIPMLRGCHRFDSITPHGWSQAEMWLLQRAVLVEEWQTGLLLFAGVPRHWLRPNAVVAFRHFPTAYGSVSARLTVSIDGASAQISLEGVMVGTVVSVRLVGQLKETVVSASSVDLEIKLN